MKQRFFVLFVLIFTCCAAFAEDDAERGRLADGRAFRTDAEGNQLVDYIAELEVNVDALSRRVQGLEYELEQKQAALNRAGPGADKLDSVKERDLVPNAQAAAVAAVSQQCPEVDCSWLLKDSQEHSRKQEQNFQQTLEQAKGDFEIEKRMHAVETNELKVRLQSLEAELASRNKEIDTLKLQPVRQAFESGEAKAGLSAVKSRALDSVRGSILTEYNQVRSLLASRDNLYQQHKKSKNPVSFRPSAAVSNEGTGLAEFKAQIAQADSILKLNQIRKGLNQVRSKLNEDLALLKRINKA